MTIRTLLIAMATTFTLLGCATTTLEKKTFKSYSVGREATATIGEAFLVDQSGSVEKVKIWVGLLFSSDGWKVVESYSKDFVRTELLYSGKSANTIEVSYREFRGGFAAPAFSQNLKYDLAESKVVRFRRFTIEVLRADNQTITYKILSD